MAFQPYDARPRSKGGTRRVNQNTKWGTVLVENGKPCLLVDGVFYDIPLTLDILSTVSYLVNTDLNPKIIDCLIRPNRFVTDIPTDADITPFWSYVYSGQKVRCNRSLGSYVVNIPLLNNQMKRLYEALLLQYPDYHKLTYVYNAKVLR